MGCDCEQREHQIGERAVDNSTWDGNAAMSRCSQSATSASCFGAICAGEHTVGDTSQRQHWALPHHQNPGAPPNAAGVRDSLSRLPQTQNLSNRDAARRHLETHLNAINAGRSADHDAPTDDLFRAVTVDAYQLRDAIDGGMPTLVLRWAVFNDWTEINSLFEGRFMERFSPKSMDHTITAERSQMRVLFQHGRDPMIGSKPLGPIDQIEAKRDGAWSYVPLLDTQYNRELLPGLRAGLYGASMRFSVDAESWDKKPERSDYNPEGLPERTVLQASVPEHGPVTFPAYSKTTAGVRSLTDQFLGIDRAAGVRELPASGLDPTGMAHDVDAGDLAAFFTGRGGQRMVPGGEHDAEPGNGEAPPISNNARLRDRRLRVEGIIK
jgi:phage head maturation protease